MDKLAMSAMSDTASMRLDKWLWAARFYKTRSLAMQAIKGGHVHVNGARCKAAKLVKSGDVLNINKNGVEFIIDILQLGQRRGPAEQARQLYAEHENSILKREQMAEQRKLEAASQGAPPKRPDKRARRKIIRFINKNQV